jgi:hypothetical protein
VAPKTASLLDRADAANWWSGATLRRVHLQFFYVAGLDAVVGVLQDAGAGQKYKNCHPVS